MKAFDLAVLVVSFTLASLPILQASNLPRAEFFAMRVKLSNLAIFLLLLLLWHVVFSVCGLYVSRRLSTLGAQVLDLLRATTASMMCLVAAALVFHIRMVTIGSMIRFWILSSAFLILSRLALRSLLGGLRRRGRNLRHILILGTNPRAVDFARNLEERPELGYRLLGFVDDPWAGLDEFERVYGPVCSDFEGLSQYLRRNVVDEVAIYLPMRSFYEHTSHIAALCEQHGIILRFDSDLFNLKIARARAEMFNGHPLITAYSGHGDGWPSVIKRILDFSLSAALLILISPVLALVALLVKATSPGPVLFLQERIGLNKRKFSIYKFRTMVAGAEKMMPELERLNEVSGPVFKIHNDPRITPLGKLLRRTSIDELPQLFNVLRGDMSLVGPRPLPLRDYEGFRADWQRRRFSVRPGITCLWQVSGRSAIAFDRWMELDLKYLDEWSLWLDLKILARTIPAVMKGSGAA